MSATANLHPKLQPRATHRRFALLMAVLALSGLQSSAIVPWTLLINTNNVIVATNAAYGALGDGLTTNTAAIQAAINAAATGGTTNGLYGGTVKIPGPGVYMCGPLTMKSGVNLQVDSGALLRMLPITQYPGGDVSPANFISASSLNDICVSGSGAIDGQGAPWWRDIETNTTAVRPVMISFGSCSRVLVQNITLSNSPMFHIAISGVKSATVNGVIVRAPSSSDPLTPGHNTDACDVSGTNILVQNCNISVGDDDYTCGGGTHDVLLTNNTYGNGHGISIGSYTDKGGVSNITVINCTINGADNGLRIKSDIGRGGLVQNINYFNISMTNVHFPIQLYAYYLWYGTPSGITPTIAASTNAISPPASATPTYRNITYSNITATSISGYPVGIIWARTEMPATNIVFNKVKVTGDRNFCLYNVSGAKFIDCNFKVSSSYSTYTMFDSSAIITNSSPSTTNSTFDGITANGYGNSLQFYNALGSLKNTNAFDDGPLTLAASTFTISNNLTWFPTTTLNYTLGTNTTKLAVVGNLALGGTNNISAGPGFTNGIYTLATWTGSLAGSLPTLGTLPPGYNYSLDTNTAKQLRLNVTPTNLPPTPPTNLTANPTNLQINLLWNAPANNTTYNLKRSTTPGDPYPTVISGLTATNYADANVTNLVTYYYTVSAVGAGGESANSSEVSAAPLPSAAPANITTTFSGGTLALGWPYDHIGWRLQAQTNGLIAGNWFDVPGATATNFANALADTNNTSVFYRLIYP